MNLERARFEANVVAKAARLKAEGYTIEPDTRCPGRWWVTRPCKTITYAVETAGEGHCGCRLFAEKRLCHHILSARLEEEDRWLDSLAAEYEARIAEAECERWGCDAVEEDNWPTVLGGSR